MSWNCNSLGRDQLEEILSHPADVYCLQVSGYVQEVVNPKKLGFVFSPRARGGRGGGVLLLYSTRLFRVHTRELELQQLDRVEIAQAWLVYWAAPTVHFVVASVYAHPAIPADSFRQDMEKILSCPARNTILAGDFNRTHVSWDPPHTGGGIS